VLRYTTIAARGLMGAFAGTAILERQQYCLRGIYEGTGLDWTFDLVQDYILSQILTLLVNCGPLF